uniref:TrsK-like protein n=1 Tax=Erysipelothrix rhusiopathiae TaxID=1648 RepID=A0A385XJ93_ERYRH|nr:TrsK-like protein [Erysipelothrix rhusiopathiae]
MSEDELELDKIGDRKTALFVIISDTDDTFNFVVSIMYSQLFNLLCDKADDVMVETSSSLGVYLMSLQ